MPQKSDRREAHVRGLVRESLDFIEGEYGVWGLDYVAELVEARRFAAVQEHEADRGKNRTVGQ